jgi:hypothetical protein
MWGRAENGPRLQFFLLSFGQELFRPSIGEMVSPQAHGMRNEIAASKQYLRTSLRDFLVFIVLLLVIRWNDRSLQ